MNTNISAKLGINPWIVWLIAVSFLLFQFFLQLSSGVVLDKLRGEMDYSAFSTGILGAAFYYVYTGLQIPVGLMFDRYNTKHLLAINALICALGCFIFALGTDYTSLFLGRVLMGAGAAFAFVGTAHIIRHHFPIQQFAFMIGISETLGFLVTVAGMIGMSLLIHIWGWRFFMFCAGFIGLLIALLCALKIPGDKRPQKNQIPYLAKILSILQSPLAWINGLFCGLGFSVITVFGALWAVPFIKIKLTVNLFQASLIASMIFLGAAISLPLFGRLYILLPRRKPLIHSSCLGTACLLLLFIYLPSVNPIAHALILFIIGLSCGAYILAFAIANELAPTDAQSSWSGFTNTLSMLTAPLMQPMIGYLLDSSHQTARIAAYQQALLIIPAALFLASLLVSLLPEKR